MTVHYPFHPLAGRELPVLAVSRRFDGCATVRDPGGFDLKIPRWMLSASARAEISPDVAIAIEALRTVLTLMEGAERLLTVQHDSMSDQFEL